MSRYLCLLLALNIFVFSMAQPDECFYDVRVQTGDQGTTSNISLLLSAYGSTLPILNLKEYGSNGPDYVYFQADSWDSFRFSGPCLGDVCTATLISDGSGNSPNWFVESVRVRFYRKFGPIIPPLPAEERIFSFKTLLSPPDSLTASVTVCSNLRSAIEIDGVPHGGSRT